MATYEAIEVSLGVSGEEFSMNGRVQNTRPAKLSFCVFAVLFLFFCVARAHADETRELVVVIDISTSMLDLFDETKSQAKQLVSSAQVGDRVTIITFGERASLIERSRIRNSYDIARLISVVDELEATEFSTNLPAGMERGLSELKQFYNEDPDNPRVMMWLSDDKDNPPDIPGLITFSTLKERESGKLPDKRWFKFERPIQPEAESDLGWFVDWVSRSKMHLSVELLTDDLGTLLAPDLERDIRLRFEPGTEAVRGSSFSVVAEVTAESGKSYSEAIPVTPSKIVCRGAPWEQTLRVLFPNRGGSYVCRISLVLPSDKLLIISPPQLTLRGKVQPEIKMIQNPVAAIDAAIRKGIRKKALGPGFATQTALASRERAELARVPNRPAQPQTSLLFGPIAARGQYQVTATLTPSRNLHVETLRMKSNLNLPRGLEFEPEFRVTGGKLFADLYLTAGANLELSDGWELKGGISFYSTQEAVEIYPPNIPVKLYTQKSASRWGRRELGTAPAYEQFGKLAAAAKGYAVMFGKWLLGFMGLYLLFYVMRRYAFGMTELVGSLEIVKNPSEHVVKPVNLRRMGRLRATNSLTVGSSKKADIVLAHDSLADWHAKITTAKTDAGTVVFVQPLHHNHVLVNDVAYTRRKEISDKDTLAIGDYTFLYRCPEMQRETIVRFNDGKSLRGVPVSWDIDTPTFEFLPKGAPSLDARMIIEFSELKAVFFMRKTRRFSAERIFAGDRRSSGRPVEIIFNDGELLEGYMVGEAGEWSKRFYLIPKERGEVALVLIEHSAVQNIFMRDTFERQPFDLMGSVKSFIGKNES
jgi:hypothetical protein